MLSFVCHAPFLKIIARAVMRLLFFVPVVGMAQSIVYTVPKAPWEANLGTHRVVVKVAQPAVAVQAHLGWRRRDTHPERHGIIVTELAKGLRIKDVALVKVDAESGDVIFRPETAGEYAIYFLPGDPGHGSFPSAKYLPPEDTVSAEWKSAAGIASEAWKSLPMAPVERWEARTEHDRFTEMEIIATAAECEGWLSKNGAVPFHVFPETREHPVRMFDHVPEIWLSRRQAPEFSARPNEYYVFQLGIWAAHQELANVSLHFSDLAAATGTARIPASALRCFQVGGVDSNGNAFTARIDVSKGNVLPLWCGLDVPGGAAPGEYAGFVEIQAEGTPLVRVPLKISIGGAPLPDRGDSDPAKHTKLRWLDSKIAEDDEPTKPFTPLKVEGRTIRCLGRALTLGDDGLPARITSYFAGGVTKLSEHGRETLAAPMRFIAEGAGGVVIPMRAEGFRFGKTDAGVVEWTSKLIADDFSVNIAGRMEFDGQVELRCALTATRPVSFRDFRLEVPRTVDTTKYSMGLGQYGGLRPEKLDWKWDVAKKDQDAIWMGDVNAGLRIQLRAENYVRPMVNIHYIHQPLSDPPSWDNSGKGGIAFAAPVSSEPLLLKAYSGERTMGPGQTLHFDCDLSITPFKLLNTEAQWRERYYQTSDMASLEKVREAGANIVNVHQGNALNPYINYPFLTADKLRDYTESAHALGLRVKYYYTVRELTNWTPELFAMRSFGSELLAPGKGGGHAWCEEHLGGNYWGAWYEPGVNDASVLTATMSRWHNVYLEGLRWLVENTGCDGLYLDDISYDRTVMKRARKILDQYDPRGGLIDLHSWNEIHDGRAGHASCALIFMDSLPYVDRMWFGEGHPYDGPAEQTLVGTSGVPFGLMGEMLQGGGNPWLGLTFGMTGRQGWGGNPKPVWKLWDDFGVSGSEFIGWWDPESPVKTDVAEVRATVWKKAGRTLIALGNFGEKPVHVRLSIDWKALGLHAEKASLHGPEMPGFQPEMQFEPNAEIAIAPKRGFAFVLDETPRTSPKGTAREVVLSSEKLALEERFAPPLGAEWKVVDSQRGAGVKPDKEGLVFLVRANCHAWAERALPNGVTAIVAQIRQDASDDGQQWGPGLAVAWPGGHILKVNRRRDGRFGVSENGVEHLAGQGDIEAPVVLGIYLDKDAIRVVASGEGAFEQDKELGRFPRSEFPGAPSIVRVGKMSNSGKAEDFSTPGEMGWSRCDWLRVYRE